MKKIAKIRQSLGFPNSRWGRKFKKCSLEVFTFIEELMPMRIIYLSLISHCMKLSYFKYAPLSKTRFLVFLRSPPHSALLDIEPRNLE